MSSPLKLIFYYNQNRKIFAPGNIDKSAIVVIPACPESAVFVTH